MGKSKGHRAPQNYGGPPVKVQLALIADAANESVEGKLNITGEFSTIYTDQPPVQWPAMVLVFRIEGSLSQGSHHTVQLDLVDDDGKAIMPRSPQLKVPMKPQGPGRPLRAQLIVNFHNMVFPKYGDYEFRLYVDGHHAESVPIYIAKRQQIPSQLHGQG